MLDLPCRPHRPKTMINSVGEGGGAISKLGTQVVLAPFGQTKCSNFYIFSYFVVKNTKFT